MTILDRFEGVDECLDGVFDAFKEVSFSGICVVFRCIQMFRCHEDILDLKIYIAIMLLLVL